MFAISLEDIAVYMYDAPRRWGGHTCSLGDAILKRKRSNHITTRKTDMLTIRAQPSRHGIEPKVRTHCTQSRAASEAFGMQFTPTSSARPTSLRSQHSICQRVRAPGAGRSCATAEPEFYRAGEHGCTVHAPTRPAPRVRQLRQTRLVHAHKRACVRITTFAAPCSSFGSRTSVGTPQVAGVLQSKSKLDSYMCRRHTCASS